MGGRSLGSFTFTALPLAGLEAQADATLPFFIGSVEEEPSETLHSSPHDGIKSNRVLETPGRTNYARSRLWSNTFSTTAQLSFDMTARKASYQLRLLSVISSTRPPSRLQSSERWWMKESFYRKPLLALSSRKIIGNGWMIHTRRCASSRKSSTS